MKRYVCYAATLAALCVGIAICYAAPSWLLCGEVLISSSAALAIGFTGWYPRLGRMGRPLKGTCCVVLGIGALYVQPQFVISFFLIGMGTRFLWASACDLALSEKAAARDLARKNGEAMTTRSSTLWKGD